jgi:hypothetical protein
MIHYQRQHAKRREVAGSNPGEVLGNFQVTCSFCSLSFALGSTRPLTEMRTKVLSWWIRAAGAESSAALVCVEYEIKDINLIFHLDLRVCYGKPLPFTWPRYANCTERACLEN